MHRIALSITAALTDPSEALSIAIAGVPAGAVLNHGTNQGGGIWALTAGQLSGLTLDAAGQQRQRLHADGDRDLDRHRRVQASASGTIAVTVNAVADTPTLSVAPASGNEDAPIALLDRLDLQSTPTDRRRSRSP